MKKLVLGSLIAVGATQVGCTTSTSSDVAHITASWAFEDLATHTMTACPTGFDTAIIVSQELDANLNFVGVPIEDVFDCSAMVGTTAGLPASWFETWVEIRQGNETGPLYAQSAGVFVDVVSVDKSVALPTILNDGGYFQLKWVLDGAVSGAAVTCTQAGASGGVESVSTEVGNPSNAASDIFNCDEGVTVDIGAGEGFTAGFLSGNYTVSVSALNGAMQSVGTAPAISGSIQPQNIITNLGTVTIPIDGL